MACDLAVMVDDAYIRHVGLEHGSVPAGGATQWLPIMVGERRAREIILLCEEIPAAAGGGLGARQPRRSGRRARRDGRRARREARGEAAADDALREAPAQLLARPLVARRPSATRATGSRSRCSARRRRAPSEASSRRTMAEALVLVERASRRSRRSSLNRPERLNALSAELMGAARRGAPGARRRPDDPLHRPRRLRPRVRRRRGHRRDGAIVRGRDVRRPQGRRAGTRSAPCGRRSSPPSPASASAAAASWRWPAT